MLQAFNALLIKIADSQKGCAAAANGKTRAITKRNLDGKSLVNVY